MLKVQVSGDSGCETAFLNTAFGAMKRLYLKDPEIVQKQASVLASPRCSWNPSD